MGYCDIVFYSGMGYCDIILQWNGLLRYCFTVDWVTVILLHSGMGYCDTILQCISVNKIYAL